MRAHHRLSFSLSKDNMGLVQIKAKLLHLCFSLLLLCALCSAPVPTEDDPVTQKVDDSSQPCPKFGRQFDVSLESKNVLRDCKLSDGDWLLPLL